MNENGVRISKGGSGLPSRIIFHGVEGLGKTSFACMSPNPLVIMTKGETGLLTLIDNGQLPETNHFDECHTWIVLNSYLQWLLERPEAPAKTLVIDTLNGAERLCFEFVTVNKFGGSWSNFNSYGRGPEVAQSEWIQFLKTLDDIRERHRMAIICLCHSRVKTFKNPEGDDFDRYTPDMHDKLWGLSAKWADVVLFGNYETFAKKQQGDTRAKGVSDGSRMLYAQRSAAYDAKNRLGLPREIPMGNSPQEAYRNFVSEVKHAREKMKETKQ